MCLVLSVPPLLQTLSRIAETLKLAIQSGCNVGTRAYIIHTHTLTSLVVYKIFTYNWFIIE